LPPTIVALVGFPVQVGSSCHLLLSVWAAVLSASNATSRRCWRRRLGSWLASAAVALTLLIIIAVSTLANDGLYANWR
jgi:hypothetical protein